MCEGPNELTLINILLENDALVFSEDDLLGLTAYHARQIKTSTQVQTALNLYDRNDVTVIRVGEILAVEREFAETWLDRQELDYLIYNDPGAYAELVMNGDVKEYLDVVKQGQ